MQSSSCAAATASTGTGVVPSWQDLINIAEVEFEQDDDAQDISVVDESPPSSSSSHSEQINNVHSDATGTQSEEPPKKKSQKNSQDAAVATALQTLASSISSCNKKANDNIDTFCAHVSSQLRLMSAAAADEFMDQIMLQLLQKKQELRNSQ